MAASTSYIMGLVDKVDATTNIMVTHSISSMTTEISPIVNAALEFSFCLC